LFKAIVYDVDDFTNINNFKNHDLVGELQFTLHEVVTAKDQILIKPICERTKKDATIEITGEELNSEVDEAQILMSPYLTFPNGNFRGEIIFMIMYRMHSGLNMPGRGNHIWKPVYKSEVKPNSAGRNGPTKFEFNQFSMLVSDLCAGDKEKEIKIEFFKSQKSGKHENVGQCLYTV
jgi:hypothetical protein